jgi:hypothetical protein
MMGTVTGIDAVASIIDSFIAELPDLKATE